MAILSFPVTEGAPEPIAILELNLFKAKLLNVVAATSPFTCNILVKAEAVPNPMDTFPPFGLRYNGYFVAKLPASPACIQGLVLTVPKSITVLSPPLILKAPPD